MRASFVLGCELWMENFASMLVLVKEYIVDLWEVRKVKLYGEACWTQPQSRSSARDSRDGIVVGGHRRGTFGKFSHSGKVTDKLSTCITDDLLGVWSMAGLLGQPLEYHCSEKDATLTPFWGGSAPPPQTMISTCSVLLYSKIRTKTSKKHFPKSCSFWMARLSKLCCETGLCR